MKKIAILGASYLQQPLVEKAKEMGVETHCFAWDNEQAVCKGIADYFYPISVLDKELILEKCVELNIDGITTISTDICMPSIAYVADKMNLISNTIESGLKSTNKFLMRSCFERNGISVPKYATLESLDLDAIRNFNYPIILKPTDRSGSKGITKVDNKNGVKSAFSDAINESIEKKAIVEEFIEGKEISVECISWEGKHQLITITDKITTNAPYFVELEHHQPAKIDKDLWQKIEDQTYKALDALGVEYGASHSEFKITVQNELYIIEVGARMGGDFIGSHLVPLSTGYDFLKAVIQIALNTFEQPNVCQKKHAGIFFLSEETKRLLPYFKETSKYITERKRTSNSLKSIRNSNDRSGYLIYQSDHKIKL
ncbi:MAG: ATP-grasp domain-containing protein [Flavobacteriales bacterium]